MADVAARAGVSLATVSRALRDVPGVHPETRARVRAVAEKLHYVVSPQASALVKRETGRIAIVVPRLDAWFYGTMIAGIERALREFGLEVMLYQVEDKAERERFFRDLPARRKVDAAILAALPMTTVEYDGLSRLGVPVYVAGGRMGDLPYVAVDDRAIGREATEHLLDLGHRRIAMVRTSDTDETTWQSDVQRVRGWREAMAARGLPSDLLITEEWSVSAGAKALDRLLELPERPTAVFAYSDELAAATVWQARFRGLSVPGDLSVIGVDGHPLAEALDITTIDQDVAAQAALIARMAATRADTGQHLLPVNLVRRTSTARPGA